MQDIPMATESEFPPIEPVDEDVVELLATMRLQERKSYGSCDYLCEESNPSTSRESHDSSSAVRSAPPSVDATCRRKMSEWFYQIVDHCKINRDTVAYTMSYIDRFLGTTTGQKYLADRSQFQLASVTAFFTAIKLHGSVGMDINTLCVLCRGSYSVKQISDMERTILKALEWKMNPPLSTAFVDKILQLLPPEHQNISNDVYEVARYQIELSISDYCFSKKLASEVAVASLLNAVEYMHSSRLARKTRRDFFFTVGSASGQDIYSPGTSALREQLLDLFAKSRGYDLKETLQLRKSPTAAHDRNEVAVTRKSDDSDDSHNKSPCCVSRR